jgi:hypothetical protein
MSGSPDGKAPSMKFGIGLSVQHRPDDDQAARFQQHVEQVRLAAGARGHRLLRLLGEHVLPHLH